MTVPSAHYSTGGSEAALSQSEEKVAHISRRGSHPFVCASPSRSPVGSLTAMVRSAVQWIQQHNHWRVASNGIDLHVNWPILIVFPVTDSENASLSRIPLNE